MQFFTTVVALFAVGSTALPGAIQPRHYGCPPDAPWRMDDRPAIWWYHICCAYVPTDGSCCNLDGPPGLEYNEKPYPMCHDKYGPGPWPEGFKLARDDRTDPRA